MRFNEIIKTLPDEVVRVVTKDYVPQASAHEAGWYAVNSSNPDDCRPEYRLPGGGVTDDDLTDLKTALLKSRGNLEQRKSKVELLIRKMDAAISAMARAAVAKQEGE